MNLKFQFGKNSVALACLIMLLGYSSVAQQKNALEEKRKSVLKEIQKTQSELERKKKEKTLTLKEKRQLEVKLEKDESELNAIVGQMSVTESRIFRSQDAATSLTQDLTDIKKKYKKLLHKILVNRLQRSEWLFLLSSVDFRQAFLRWQYLKQYQKHRLEQVRFIRSTITSLENKIKNLSVEKTEFALHKEEMQQQQQILNSELEKREALIKSLSQSEKTLLSQLENQKKKHEDLNIAIENAIRSEILRKRKKAIITSTTPKIKGKPSSSAPSDNANTKNVEKETEISYTAEESKLSNKFELNKGKLPSPVSKGTIFSNYGLVSHPVFKHIKYTNHGIDIRTTADANVRSIFDGEIVGIKFVPGANYNIIIRHGNYLTVYANVTNVIVKEGDMVKSKQTLGKAAYDPTMKVNEVHFEVWKDKERLNPSLWISL